MEFRRGFQFLLWNIILVPWTLCAQNTLQITPTSDIKDLVESEFIKSNECIEVFNIQAIGRLNSIGSFRDGGDAILMEEGIVFSTGFLEAIDNVNRNTQLSGQLYGPAQAPYIQEAVKSPITLDAVGIEFDFIPNQRLVNFNYVFASDEYCEFVGSEFNDAFGFFISGPGIEGDGFDNSINIAKVPEKEAVVSINNINHEKNSEFYINNVPLNNAEMCGFGPVDTRTYPIEFDGFTRRLEAVVAVIPCETYHIRLVVADIGDDLVDSAVFLEGKSFETNGGIDISARVKKSDGLVMYENCLEGEFLFTKSRLISNDATTVNFIVQGTAIMGQDFTVIEDSIFFSSNAFREVVPIVVIPDSIEEGLESIQIITETINCDCITRDTATLFIDDQNEDLGLGFEDPVVCIGQPFTIGPTLETAVEPISYAWSTGDTTATITDSIDTPQTYQVAVKDFCGAEDSISVMIRFQNIPELSISGNFDWCLGREPESLSLVLPGQAPWSLRYTIDDGPSILMEDIDENPFPFPLNQVGTYNFIGFNDEHCTGIVQGEVIVESLPFDLEHLSIPPSCRGANDGSIELNIIDGVEPFTIDWGQGIESNTTLSALFSGAYSVSVRDSLGCIVSDSILVEAAASDANCKFEIDMNLFIPNAFTPNGDNINDTFTIYPKFGLIKSARYRIFDRWGGIAFESGAITATERSSINWTGDDYQAGLYLCIVELELVNGSLRQVAQEVMLLH